MTYRVEVRDDVVEEVVRFSDRTRRSWDHCLTELARSPWPTTARDYSITAERSISGETFYVMFAGWFGALILFDAVAYVEPVDGMEGLVVIFALRSPHLPR